MKYIKEKSAFFKDDKSYIEVEEYQLNVDFKDIEILTDSDLSSLEKYLLRFDNRWVRYLSKLNLYRLSHYNFSWITNYDFNIDDKLLIFYIRPQYNVEHTQFLNNTEFTIEVIKSHDEFFIVKISMNTIRTFHNPKYFKCDQIEGVSECLESEIMNWFE